MATHTQSRRRGFTLIELLVVIAILGILVGLLLPAVQMARESGRRVACQSNMRQWGLAFHQHADVTGVFPWGYHRTSPTGTFVAPLLPYIEQTNLRYDTTRNWNDPANLTAIRSELAVLLCPSAPGEHRFDDAWPDLRPAAGDYVGTGGVNPVYCDLAGWPHYSPSENNGVLIHRRCGLPEVTDGLSNTFLLLEDAGRPQLWRMGRLASGRSNNAGWADPDYSIALDGSDTQLTGSGQAGGTCVMNCTNDNEAYSFHPGICLSLLGDASVRTLYQGMDARTFAALSTRASGEVVGE